MGEAKALEFFVVQYALEEVGSINLAVAVVEPTVGDGVCEVRFTRDWEKLLSFDPDADIPFLEALVSEMENNLRSPLLRERMLRTMESSFRTPSVSLTESCVLPTTQRWS